MRGRKQRPRSLRAGCRLIHRKQRASLQQFRPLAFELLESRRVLSGPYPNGAVLVPPQGGHNPGSETIAEDAAGDSVVVFDMSNASTGVSQVYAQRYERLRRCAGKPVFGFHQWSPQVQQWRGDR